MKKELKVSAIKEGTVIDHIPVLHTFKIAELLKAGEMKSIVSIASNLDSKKLGKKGIIKVGGQVKEKDISRISILAPGATISIIKDYKVIRKSRLEVPYEVVGIVKCFNPNCITNKDKISSKFTLINKSKLTLRCRYCERVMSREEIKVV